MWKEYHIKYYNKLSCDRASEEVTLTKIEKDKILFPLLLLRNSKFLFFSNICHHIMGWCLW